MKRTLALAAFLYSLSAFSAPIYMVCTGFVYNKIAIFKVIDRETLYGSYTKNPGFFSGTSKWQKPFTLKNHESTALSTSFLGSPEGFNGDFVSLTLKKLSDTSFSASLDASDWHEGSMGATELTSGYCQIAEDVREFIQYVLGLSERGLVDYKRTTKVLSLLLK